MRTRIDILGTARDIVGGIFGVLGYFFRFLRLMLLPKAVLVAKRRATEIRLAACVDEKGTEATVHEMPAPK